MWKDTSIEGPRQVAPAAVARSTSRRKRTSFSKEHVELLRTTFETDRYPGISLRESLSQTTGLPESRIQVWFQNRRARTLKCKGAKSDSPTQEDSLPMDTEGGPQPGMAPLSAQCPPPPYPAQVKEELVEDRFYGSCPPAYSTLEETGRHSSMFGLHQGRFLGTTSSPTVRSPGHQMVPGRWPQTGDLPPPSVQSLWSPSPLEVRNYSSGSSQGFLYPEQQQPFFMSQTQAPATPDFGCWEVGQENTPPMEASNCQLEGSWSGAVPESYWPPQHQHAPLPELPAQSLQEILGDLEGELGWGDGLDSHITCDNNLVY